MLLNQHSETLREFRVFRLTDDFDESRCLPPLKLEEIECRCLEPTSRYDYNIGYEEKQCGGIHRALDSREC
jgi:hypothetical protein